MRYIWYDLFSFEECSDFWMSFGYDALLLYALFDCDFPGGDPVLKLSGGRRFDVKLHIVVKYPCVGWFHFLF